MSYYRANLARIHHVGYGDHAAACAPGVIRLLEPYRGGKVVELGCGSGALTRHLIDAGFEVIATDASPALLELAAEAVPEADLHRLVLPHDPIPPADAIVAVGHVFNYLSTSGELESSVNDATESLRPGGLLATDVCDLRYAMTRADHQPYAEVREDWAMFTRFSSPDPGTFVRGITTFVRQEDGSWSRDDEVHRNVLVDVRGLAGSLRRPGFEVEVRTAFGEETPIAGIDVLLVRRGA